MIPDDPTLSPALPRPAQPVPLDYALPASGRPGSIATIGVIGIVMASLGLLAAAYNALQSFSLVMFRTMGWVSPGVIAVSVGEAVVGAALAGTLLGGSIGLLRLRPWSRRLLLSWAWVYLLADGVGLLLQILVVAPGQAGMYTKMAAFTPPAAPTTLPITVTAAPTLSGTVYSSSVTVVQGSGPVTTAAPGMPGGPGPAQMAAMMQTVFVATASGKAVICVVFPIFVLVVLRLKSVRAALAA